MFLTLAIGTGAAAAYLARNHIRTAFDDLFEEVSADHGVSSSLLRAIASWEHRDPQRPLEPAFTEAAGQAVSPPNRNGTRDYGLMQINEVTGAALGFSPQELLDPRKNLEAAALLLRRLPSELGGAGGFMQVIAAYNAGSPAIRKRGIFNPSYVQGVVSNFILFAVGRGFRGFTRTSQ